MKSSLVETAQTFIKHQGMNFDKKFMNECFGPSLGLIEMIMIRKRGKNMWAIWRHGDSIEGFVVTQLLWNFKISINSIALQ